MRPLLIAIPALVLVGLGLRIQTAEPEQPVRKSSGLEKRELWTTSKVVGSPEPPAPYRLVPTYPKLKFDEALELTPIPGKPAWVVAERPGKIYRFDADPKTATGSSPAGGVTTVQALTRWVYGSDHAVMS